MASSIASLPMGAGEDDDGVLEQQIEEEEEDQEEDDGQVDGDMIDEGAAVDDNADDAVYDKSATKVAKPNQIAKQKKCGKRLAYHCIIAKCICRGKRTHRPKDMKHTAGQEPVLKRCRWPKACRLCSMNKCK